jgi:ribonuclease HI
MNTLPLLHVFTDGASRGNPGPAGIGVYAYDGTPEHPIFAIGYSFYRYTNNVAEYAALILALQTLIRIQWKGPIAIHADSLLMVKQMNKEYRVKNPQLLYWYTLATKLRSQITCTITHVRREHNTQADAMANKGIDEKIQPSAEFEQLWRKAIPQLYWPTSYKTAVQQPLFPLPPK